MFPRVWQEYSLSFIKKNLVFRHFIFLNKKMTVSHRYLFDGEACDSLDELFRRYRDASHKAHISLMSADGRLMQSVPVGNGLYYCEVGDAAHGYVCPHEMPVEELEEQFRRFNSGEDFSFVEKEWSIYEPSSSPLPTMVKWIALAALIDAAIIMAFTGFPAIQTVHLSYLLHTFARFLFS